MAHRCMPDYPSVTFREQNLLAKSVILHARLHHGYKALGTQQFTPGIRRNCRRTDKPQALIVRQPPAGQQPKRQMCSQTSDADFIQQQHAAFLEQSLCIAQRLAQITRRMQHICSYHQIVAAGYQSLRFGARLNACLLYTSRCV